jgi:hypothetical protein
MLRREKETPMFTVARRVMNCAANEIVAYIKASDCLHDCTAVTCTLGSLPTFILNIYLRLNYMLLYAICILAKH